MRLNIKCQSTRATEKLCSFINETFYIASGICRPTNAKTTLSVNVKVEHYVEATTRITEWLINHEPSFELAIEEGNNYSLVTIEELKNPKDIRSSAPVPSQTTPDIQESLTEIKKLLVEQGNKIDLLADVKSIEGAF